MHRSRLSTIVIDCQADDLEGASAFWSAALGYPVGKSNDPYADLNGPAAEPKVLLQRVDHASRVHLDIETDDLDAEVTRLEALGAKVVGAVNTWVVMEAPTGHRFCVVRPQRPDFPADAVEWPSV